MLPYVDIFGYKLSMYGVCVLMGIFAAALLTGYTTKKRRDFSKIQIINIPLFSVIGAFIGAHILYAVTRTELIISALTHWSRFTSSPQIFFGVLGEVFGGMVFYGGLIGAVAAAAVYCRAAKLEFDRYADIFAPSVPLFHAFGRIGCYLSGCCYGIVSEYGIVYHSDNIINGLNDVPRIPIQLIEAGCNIIIMIALVALSRVRFKEGSLLAMYFIMYSVVRFIDEFFRGDEIRGQLLGLTTSQWVSILIFAAGIIMILRRYVFVSTRDKYRKRLEYGEVPEGCIYNRYAGAVPQGEFNP